MQGQSISRQSIKPVPKRLKLGRFGLPLGGAAAIIALALLAAPVVGGSTSTITFTAPYAQLAKIYSSTVTSVGCHAFASDPVTPAIDAKNGVITSWQHSVAGNCMQGTVYAYTDATLGFTGPKWTAPSSGNITVTATWSIDWSARATVADTSNGAAGSAYASSYLALTGWVEDTSTGGYTNGSSGSWVLLTSLSTTNGTAFAHSAGATTYTLTISLWAQKGDWYTLGTELLSDTYDSAVTCGQTAWSNVDLGSGSHSATLMSVTVS